MPTPRDLFKTRAQKIGEVYSNIHLKSGHANSQLLAFGGDLSANGTGFGVSIGEGVIGNTIVQFAAVASTALPAGATTAAGVYRKVLVEIDKTGAVFATAGPGSVVDQATATLPAKTVGRLALGWVEIPPSFTQGATAVSGGMVKKFPYFGS